MRTIITVGLLLLSCASALRAEINIGSSAEWLTHDSSLAALATPVDVQTNERTTKCRYRLDDVIKGPQSVGDTVTVFALLLTKADVLALDKALKSGTQMLVFAKVAESFDKEIDGKYFLHRQICRSAYFSNTPIEDLYTPDFHTIVKFDDLVSRTRAQVTKELELKQQGWQGEIRRQSVDVPSDSEAWKRLYSGSACYLWVPEYIPLDQKNGTKP